MKKLIIIFFMSFFSFAQDCTLPINSDLEKCAGANPEYCKLSGHSNSKACLPKNDEQKKEWKFPKYCQYKSYRHFKTCAGSKPWYCKISRHKQSLACQ